MEGAEVYRRLSPLIGLREDDHVLDFGCGIGGVGAHLARGVPKGRYVGVDISAEAIKEARRILADCPNMSLAVISEPHDIAMFGFFHIVLAHSVFTHNPASVFRKFLQACAPVLHPGGRLYATFAISSCGWTVMKTDFVYTETEVLDSSREMGW